ncbi:pilin [Patescibacteria group bacterium]|nr:pilin [Patescibacteria group bacterium]
MIKNKKIINFIFLLAIFLILVQPLAVQASIFETIRSKTVGFGDLPDYSATENSPELIAGRIIGYLLSFLGVLFIILIIYGGFMWMTASGNDEQVEKAKKMIKRATIGLFIVLASAAIAWSVFLALSKSNIYLLPE